MITDPRVNASRRRHWALWLFMFVGFVLHAGLTPPNAHGIPGPAVRSCVSPAAGAPPILAERAGEADGPCAPPSRPHRHAPCVDVTHRGFSPERPARPCPAGAPARCPLPAERPDPAACPGAGPCSSRPVSPRSGAGLRLALCSSRT